MVYDCGSPLNSGKVYDCGSTPNTGLVYNCNNSPLNAGGTPGYYTGGKVCSPYSGVICNICRGNYAYCSHRSGVTYGAILCSPSRGICNICGTGYGSCPHISGHYYGGTVCSPYSGSICNICNGNYSTCSHISGQTYGATWVPGTPNNSHVHNSSCATQYTSHTHTASCAFHYTTHLHSGSCLYHYTTHTHSTSCSTSYTTHTHTGSCSQGYTTHTHNANCANHFTTHTHTASCSVSNFPDIQIVFSNILNGAHGSTPSDYNYTEKSGKLVDGIPMVKLTDIASALGASITYFDYTCIYRNGIYVFFPDSYTNSFHTQTSYIIRNPSTGSDITYNFIFNGESPKPIQTIDGYEYVPLKTTADALGALMCTYVNGKWRVYDFRVNGTSSYADDNTYIVGGKWITDWNNYGAHNVSPNFTLSQLWDHSFTSHEYTNQIKLSVKTLQTIENIKYHYGTQGFDLPNAFRSWNKNETLGESGSWTNSFHMRGRAYDVSNDYLYTSIFDEFNGNEDEPVFVTNGRFWRTKVEGTLNDKSGGYEIERMEGETNPWLHVQTKPGMDNGVAIAP